MIARLSADVAEHRRKRPHAPAGSSSARAAPPATTFRARGSSMQPDPRIDDEQARRRRTSGARRARAAACRRWSAKSSSGWLSVADEAAEQQSAGAESGLLCLVATFAIRRMIAAAKKGMVTSPPSPWVKPRWAAIGSIPNSGATKLSMSGRFADEDQRRHGVAASGASAPCARARADQQWGLSSATIASVARI